MRLIFKLFAIPALLLSPYISNSQDLSYTVSVQWLEGAEDSVGLYVSQSGDKASASFEVGGKLTQVSDLQAGIRSASLNSDMGVLLDEIGTMKPLKEGDAMDLGFGQTGIVKSFTYSLSKGNNKQTIEGQKTDHYVLSVKLEWGQVREDGVEITGISSGKSDLWISKKLPFSWLPYTLSSGNYAKSAVPLSFLHPEIAGFLLNHFSEELSGMGLLLKARSEVTQRQVSDSFDSSNKYVKEVSIGNIDTNAEVQVEIPDMEIMSQDLFANIMVWLFISRDYCGEPSGAIMNKEGGSNSIMVDGLAEVKETDESKNISWISMGVMSMRKSDDENGCLIIGTDPPGPVASIYSVTDQSGFGTNDQSSALVGYLRTNNGAPIVTIFDQGTFEVRDTGGGMRARLNATGTSVQLDRSKSTITKEISGQFSIDIKPLAVAPPEPPKAPMVSIPAWVAIPFSMSGLEKSSEIAFSGNEGRLASVDAYAKIAAVSLSEEPKLITIDLESGEELATIDLPNGYATTNMSLAMAQSGNRLAIGGTAGDIMITNPRTGNVLKQWKYGGSNGYSEIKPLAFDERNNRLYSASQGNIVIWDIETGTQIFEWRRGIRFMDFELNADGSRIFLTGDEGFEVYDTGSKDKVCSVGGQFWHLAVHPNGEEVAVVDFQKTVRIYDSNSCEELRSWKAGEGSYVSMTWAPDGESLLMGDYSTGDITLHNSENGEIKGTVKTEEATMVISATHSGKILTVGPKTTIWK